MTECVRPILSLFCGAGGLDYGFLQAGFTPFLAIDADNAAISTYRRNNPSTRAELLDIALLSENDLIALWGSVTDLPPIGVIGGPPCQSFSKGNRYIKSDDPRRYLTNHYARLLQALNQRFAVHFFVFENVAGLLSQAHRNDLEAFRQLFEAAGFRLFEAILDAKHYGVPQKRSRLLIVGVNAEMYPTSDFGIPGAISPLEIKTVRTAIEGLAEPMLFRRNLRPVDIPLHPNHWTMVPRSPKFQDPNLGANWSRGRSFRVLSWDAPSWTVAYGHREVHVHPNGHRRLSVLEAMRLQGFPDTYVLEGTLSEQFRLVGDAVPPPLARVIATALSEFLNFEPHVADHESV